ncbi:phosphate permease [Marinobacter adhaerens]|jgi:PiT family inorganic phosphate transporter|uniref:Phosphate transporter n=2 Tax=Marinobacter TaxID=2742 RepID=A0A1E3CDR9_9GAMM|nr:MULTISPECIES: inorganic phosphate transporter [Marinobacter]MBY6071717.1 inorganic phosphate transporter [Marinobacter salsuginis]MTI99201.1 inorganic phosphate transporter [Marinobacter adhaerens]ODM33152.1 phosphate permease [Marinobacter adhaerens]QTN42858.1 inorganic phosphate transporter [Marinobacter salsuginis]
MARSSGYLDTLLTSPTTERYRVGISLLFLLGVWLTVGSFSQGMPNSMLLMAAAVIGGYMAINIGANDVANNVGPAVGSGALSLGAAVVIAAIFEAGGAIIAGGDVVSTIKGGIIDPSNLEDSRAFVWLMTAALLAGALWLNLATWMGAPVSTTHSIVGGVLGAGIAAGGWGIADWAVMGKIAASWVISPVLGGALAALFLFAIKKTVLYRKEVIPAARTFVPWLVAIMAWAFGTYLMIKGVKKIVKVDFLEATLIGLAAAAVVFFIMRTLVGRMASTMENSSAGVNTLFTWPLIFAAALLSFAHGANDVANAIGPLAAINDALSANSVVTSASIPMWVMMVGALGLAVGLMLFGPRLIKTVGSEITELDKTRAFCIALSAALTVILASQLGLPVSSTHIAIGGVFGVGFLREYLKSNYATQLHKIMEHHDPAEQERLKPFLDDFRNASVEEMENLLKQAKKKKQVPLSKSERKRLKKIYREEMVKRSHLVRIAAAWIITVPASAIMAATLFFTLRGLLI